MSAPIPNKALIVDRQQLVQSKKVLRTDLIAFAYVRFSTMVQVKNSLQSKKMQDLRMVEKIEKLGFTDIRVMDKDEGISGQKNLDERLDLAEIYRAMRNGTCGIIGAFNASRLWRDKTHVFYSEFIDMCKRYNVPVMLNNRIYWCVDKTDEEALRAEFIYAQKALDQAYEVMNPARLEAVQSGSYGGHAIAPGFLVIGEKGDRHFVPYLPHLDKIKWLFKRYRQLSGNLGKLGRELEQADFHLPPFDDTIENIPHLALKRDNKGYKLVNRNALICVLTNQLYIGRYIFNGVVIYDKPELAVIDREDFMYAFTRLSKYTLDGEINENKPTIERSYTDVDALFDGILKSNGLPVYPMAKGKTYVARDNTGAWKTTELVVQIEQLDTAFGKMLTQLVRQVASYEDFRTRLFPELPQSKLVIRVEGLLSETEGRAGTLQEALTTIVKGIKHWTWVKQQAQEAQYQPDYIEAVRNLKKLETDKAAIERKLNNIDKEAELLTECGDLLEEARNQYEQMKFAKKHRLVKLIVESADIVEVSPHVLKLTVQFNDVLDYLRVECYLWRARGSKHPWNEADNKVLTRMYPTCDKVDIMEALPTRTWEACIMQAGILELSRPKLPTMRKVPDQWTWEDVKLFNKLGLNLNFETMPHWIYDWNTKPGLLHQ